MPHFSMVRSPSPWCWPLTLSTPPPLSPALSVNQPPSSLLAVPQTPEAASFTWPLPPPLNSAQLLPFRSLFKCHSLQRPTCPQGLTDNNPSSSTPTRSLQCNVHLHLWPLLHWPPVYCIIAGASSGSSRAQSSGHTISKFSACLWGT